MLFLSQSCKSTLLRTTYFLQKSFSRRRLSDWNVTLTRKVFADVEPVSQYCAAHSEKLSKVQQQLISETMDVPMGIMLGSADVLQFLGNISRVIGAKKILDIGTFTGYSALSIALALPDDGKVITMDVSDQHAEMCKKYWSKAGVSDKIDFRVAPALDTLKSLLKKHGEGSFDLAFIDADKNNYKNYYEICLKLVRPGGLIAIDNVVWNMKVLDKRATDSRTVAIRKFNEFVANDDRAHVTMLWIGDGVTFAFKK